MLLILVSGYFLVKMNRGLEDGASSGISNSLSKKEAPNLYSNLIVERDQKGMTRGRFFRLDRNYLYLEYHYDRLENQPVAKEVITLEDSTVFDCEDRYLTIADGTRIDKLAAMVDSSRYEGERLGGGLGMDWFRKNVKVGEAVEVRFEGTGSDRKPAVVLLYRDTCKEL